MRYLIFMVTVVGALFCGAMTTHAGEPACASQVFEAATFTVCPFDSRTADLSLVRTDAKGGALRRFDRVARFLGSRAGDVRFAMNAGMFDSDGAAIGLYVEDGVVRHGLNTANAGGNFYLKPNGVFFIDDKGAPKIETAEVFAGHATAPRWATQSGPMLVIHGALNPQISPDGTSKYIRNAVGIRHDGTAVFVISDDAVSFGRLARFLRDDLGCDDALYLDGAVSSLWVPSQGRQDNRAPLGPMVIVSAKAR